ncbi:MAG: response regulator [Salaquimonas sp.]
MSGIEFAGSQLRARYVLVLFVLALATAAFGYLIVSQSDRIERVAMLSSAHTKLNDKVDDIVRTGSLLALDIGAERRFSSTVKLQRLSGELTGLIEDTEQALKVAPQHIRKAFFKVWQDYSGSVLQPYYYLPDTIGELVNVGEDFAQANTFKVIKNHQAVAVELRGIKEVLISNNQAKITTLLIDSLAGHTKPLYHIAIGAIVAGLGLLIFAGLFIFRPMEKRLDRYIAELHDSQKKMEIAERTKSEFLANMSHEIRTPMNGVMGMAELLAKTELNPRQRTFTEIIVKSGASLLTIINDILDFSKIDAGQMELDPAPFVLSEAIEDVATLISSKVAEKDLELILRIDPNMPEKLIGDVGRIRQIVTNIVGNAVKFTDNGHIYVNAYVKDQYDENSQKIENADRVDIQIDIEDTGVGIAKEQATAIFEKFSQVDGSATRKHEGTGLGLSISSALVRLMNGKISLVSEVDKGSTFSIEVSLPVDTTTKAKKRIPTDVSGARVLIVDDNEVNRAILMEQTQAWKFDSACASSGTEALSLLEAAYEHNMPVDCIILDYHMPAMNGGDVVKALRSNPRMQNVPVVMLTSVDQTEEGKTFSSLGIEAHLTKPARSTQLLETIVDVLEVASARNDHSDEATKGIMIAQQIARGNNQTAKEMGGEFPSSKADVPAHVGPIAVEVETSTPILVPAVKQANKIDILVCEDNEVNQIVFTQILQSAGYEFIVANDGMAGVEAFELHAPDLVLMDVSMPRMNGIQATAAIRKLDESKGTRTPIIGVTAHAIKGDMERCLDGGMDDYLSKPVSPDRLLEKIELHLSQSKRALVI